MLALFLRLERCTCRLALLIAVVMLVISVTLGLYQVVTRFVFDAPSAWSEVAARSAMIWCVMTGVAASFRGGFMMAVEVAYKLVPSRYLVSLEVLIACCCLIVLGVLIYFGIVLTWRVRFQMLAGLEVSIAWAYVAIPVGAVFSFLAVVARLMSQLVGHEPIGPVNEEDPAATGEEPPGELQRSASVPPAPVTATGRRQP